MATIEKEKALDVVRQMVADGQVSQEVAEKYFPELKESEDEKIRKQIKAFIKSRGSQITQSKTDAWLAWLEKQGEHANFRNKIQIGDKVTRNKDGVLVNLSQLNRVAKKQGEQKPADKVEPKFKVGDWVVSPNGVYWHIDAIDNNRYEVTANTGESSDWPLDTNIYHRFTIQDTNVGDALEFGDHGRLVVGIVSYVNKTTGKVDVSCLLENNNFKMGNYYNLDTIKPHPATKEQRDTLMKAIADAGYTFDFEKKELKKIEQKPAWSEEDGAMLYGCIETEQYMLDVVYGRKEFNVGSESIKEECQKELDWLKSLKERYTWKPSDEQMKALQESIGIVGELTLKGECLKELVEQLKAL